MYDIKELFLLAVEHNEARYRDIQHKFFIHNLNGTAYGLKPMFIEKYTKAYVMGLDDLNEGVSNPMVNISIYQDYVLVNIDISFADFKELYREVKNKVRAIEKKYQQLLAELNTLQVQVLSDPVMVETRLQEIITSNPYVG